MGELYESVLRGGRGGRIDGRLGPTGRPWPGSGHRSSGIRPSLVKAVLRLDSRTHQGPAVEMGKQEPSTSFATLP